MAAQLVKKRNPAGSTQGISRPVVREKVRDLAEKGDVEAQELQKQWEDLARERKALDKELRDVHKEIHGRK